MRYLKNRKLFENNNNNQYDIQKVLDGYLEAAIWADGDDFEHEGLGVYDYDKDSKFNSTIDILKLIELTAPVMEEHGELLGVDIEEGKFGHTFWLARKGHGVVFYDNGDICKDLGEAIDIIVDENFEEVSIYAENGVIYIDDYSKNKYGI